MSYINNKNLIIHYVRSKYTAQYIADTLLKKNIAQVRKITLIPQDLAGDASRAWNTAYVEIDYWIDSNNGLEALDGLNQEEEPRFFILYHTNDFVDSFTFELNKYNDGSFEISGKTTYFFVKETNNIQALKEDENSCPSWYSSPEYKYVDYPKHDVTSTVSESVVNFTPIREIARDYVIPNNL